MEASSARLETGVAGTTQNSETQKPKRVSKACDRCNARRQRCDAGNPCAHCFVAGVGCTYVREPVKRRKSGSGDWAKASGGPATRRRKSIRTDGEELHGIGASVGTIPNRIESWPVGRRSLRRGSVATVPSDSGYAAAGPDAPYARPRRALSLGSTTLSLAPEDDPWSREASISSFSTLEVSGTDFLHKASDNARPTSDFLPTTSRNVSETSAAGQDILPQSQFILDLPPLPIASILLELYCNRVHPRYPIIHRQTFLQTYTLTGYSKPSPLLLNAVFAAACSTSSDAELHKLGVPVQYTVQYFYSSIQKLLLDATTGPPDLDVIVALFLATRVAPLAGERPWIYSRYLGIALRIGLEIGLHTELPIAPSPVHSDGPSNMRFPSWAERETRRRVWWALYQSDRLMSAILHLPPTVPDTTTLQLPCPDTEFQPPDSATVEVAPVPDGAAITQNRQTTPLESRDAHVHMLLLTDLAGKVGVVKAAMYQADIQNVNRGPLSGNQDSSQFGGVPWGDGWEPGGRLSELDRHLVSLHSRFLHKAPYSRNVVLKSWSHCIPSPLDIASGTTHLSLHFALLHLTYSGVRTLLHRPVDLARAHLDSLWLTHPSFPAAFAESVRAGEVAFSVMSTALHDNAWNPVTQMDVNAAYWALQSAVVALVPIRLLCPLEMETPLAPSVLSALLSMPPPPMHPLLQSWAAIGPRLSRLPELLVALLAFANAAATGDPYVAAAVQHVADVLVHCGVDRLAEARGGFSVAAMTAKESATALTLPSLPDISSNPFRQFERWVGGFPRLCRSPSVVLSRTPTASSAVENFRAPTESSVMSSRTGGSVGYADRIEEGQQDPTAGWSGPAMRPTVEAFVPLMQSPFNPLSTDPPLFGASHTHYFPAPGIHGTIDSTSFIPRKGHSSSLTYLWSQRH